MTARRRKLLGAARCPAGRISLQKVRLDSGGYDESGRYFGSGWERGVNVAGDVYVADMGDGYLYVRARSRAGAKAAVRKKCPGARFYR